MLLINCERKFDLINLIVEYIIGNSKVGSKLYMAYFKLLHLIVGTHFHNLLIYFAKLCNFSRVDFPVPLLILTLGSGSKHFNNVNTLLITSISNELNKNSTDCFIAIKSANSASKLFNRLLNFV